ncbi:nucleotidyltransferase family protein [Paenibacillus aurantius]|uniref:Nucleotidyltransferase family protein n=1 Tax=Paenibacillus aurantius TaxID=2918900 RepID=A0AA96L9K7_9BACL|nr:nucleotidyltransferase family protein [Paenibacillus aurantius]WNQ09654.1 nucleotidyltransferase family protein [Paenibacillus aurantius]
MSKAIEELKNYIKENSGSANEFLLNLNHFGLENIYFQEYKNKDEYLNLSKFNKHMKGFGETVEKELEQLAFKFEEAGIKLVHFKGVLLAKELYSPPELRKFSDIDVLIDTNYLAEALDIFRELGYVFSEGNKVPSINTKLNFPFFDYLTRTCHIQELVKTIYVDEEPVKLFVDLHARIFNDLVTEWSYVKSIILRALKSDKYWLLEHNDRLIHLLCNFTKDYIDTGIMHTFLGQPVKKKLVSLLDSALLIDKYTSLIHWDTIISRSMGWGKQGELLFALKIFNEIFKQRVPSEVFTKLEENLGNYKNEVGYKVRALPYYLRKDPNSILWAERLTLYRESINEMDWKGPILRISEAERIIVNRECIKLGNSSDEERKISFRFDLKIEDKYLIVQTLVHDEWFTHSKINNSNSNFISLYFGTSGIDDQGNRVPLVQILNFYPKYNTGDVNLLYIWNSIKEKDTTDSYTGDKNTIPFTHPYKLNAKANGYELTIYLPLNELLFYREGDSACWFDINVSYSNEDGKGRECILAYANRNGQRWYDPSCYAKLILNE